MLERKIKKYLDQELNQSFPGYSFGLVYKNKAPIFIANGKLNYQDQVNNVNSESIYDLASLTKVIATTSAILKLLEENKIHLRQKVKEILPRFQVENTTIYHLLTHTSGLPADLKTYKAAKNKAEFIEFVYQVQPELKLDEKVIYSDFNFLLLGFIVGYFKNSLPNYLREILLQPLKMENTTYQVSDLQKSNTASTEISPQRGLIHGEVHDGKAYLLGGESGNAGLFSNVIDLSTFATMLLNNGRYQNQTIFKSETIDLLKKSYTSHLNEPRTLGWMSKNHPGNQGDYLSDEIIYHTGFSGTSFLLDFKKEIAIILLTNRVNPTRDNQRIIDVRPILSNLIYLNLKET